MVARVRTPPPAVEFTVDWAPYGVLGRSGQAVLLRRYVIVYGQRRELRPRQPLPAARGH